MLCGVTATVGSNPTATASFPRYCNEKQYRGNCVSGAYLPANLGSAAPELVLTIRLPYQRINLPYHRINRGAVVPELALHPE